MQKSFERVKLRCLVKKKKLIPHPGSSPELDLFLKKNKIVAHCIKQYLISHVKGSNRMTIEGVDQLRFAIFLPIENFNTSKQKVWKDSLRMV